MFNRLAFWKVGRQEKGIFFVLSCAITFHKPHYLDDKIFLKISGLGRKDIEAIPFPCNCVRLFDVVQLFSLPFPGQILFTNGFCRVKGLANIKHKIDTAFEP